MRWMIYHAETGAWDGQVLAEEPVEVPEGMIVRTVPASYVRGLSYWDAELKGFYDAVTITPLQFQRRFTVEERIAIRASSDPLVIDWLELSKIAQGITLGDPDVIAGAAYLEQQGLIGPGRAAQILAP